MPIDSPADPTYRAQPNVDACSTATRAVMSGGSTLSLYPWSCFSNSSQEGMLTTRAAIPLPSASRMRRHKDLAAAREQQHLQLAVRRIGEHIRTFGQARGRSILRAVVWRQRLPAEDERHRSVPQLHDDAPGLNHFVRVCRAQGDESGDGAQRGQLLDRLVRAPVLAQTNGVVREDVDHRELHDRAQADRRPRVIAEDQEPGAVGSYLGE